MSCVYIYIYNNNIYIYLYIHMACDTYLLCYGGIQVNGRHNRIVHGEVELATTVPAVPEHGRLHHLTHAGCHRHTSTHDKHTFVKYLYINISAQTLSITASLEAQTSLSNIVYLLNSQLLQCTFSNLRLIDNCMT